MLFGIFILTARIGTLIHPKPFRVNPIERRRIVPDKRGGLNGSLQHSLEVCKQKLTKAKFIPRR